MRPALTLTQQEQRRIRRWSAVEQAIRIASGAVIVAVFLGLMAGAALTVMDTAGCLK